MGEDPAGCSYRLSPRVRYRIIDDEAVVIQQATGEALVLNDVAARVLQLVDGGVPLDKMIATLHAEYEVDEDQLRADVDEVLAELEGAQVLVKETP